MNGRSLDPAIAQRLARLLGMLGSAHDGECLNAARLADKLVRQCGLTWPAVVDLLPPAEEEEWRGLLAFCSDRIEFVSSKEANFIDTLRRTTRYRPPSEGQMVWLIAIAERLREMA